MISRDMLFSVLMSVYRNERPDFLAAALDSLLQSTIPVPEIVLVEDGSLTMALYRTIASYEPKLNLRRVPLTENMGLGKALTQGLHVCTHAWVARFDTDDLIVPDRFERQLAWIAQSPDVDLLGGWISEFSESPDEKSLRLRRVPQTHAEITAYARKRNPFNHMTVMFKRDFALALGGYRSEHLYEDYALWVRMIQAGATTANVPSVLVRARTGSAMYQRRGGLRYLASEARAQWSFYRSGFIGKRRLLLNLAMRIPVRLIPSAWRGWTYGRLLRGRDGGAP